MATNPDNVGGLPELPQCVGHLHSGDDYCPERVVRADLWPVSMFTEDQMRAYGELCRAAPAGGEYRDVIPQALDETINGVVSDLEMIAAGKDQVTGYPVSCLQSQRIAKSAHGRLLSAWNACEAAPAGGDEASQQENAL